MIRRSKTPVIALGIIAAAAVVAALVHRLLGLLSLDIAVAKSSGEDRQAAEALTQLFETQHPRVRFRTIYEPDRLGTAAALDKGDARLALIRSDAAAKDGQTRAILRRDAIVLVAPGRSAVDSIAKLKGSTVGLLDGRKLDPRLLDLILTHFGVPPEGGHRKVLTVDQVTEAAQPTDRFGVRRGSGRQRRVAAAVHGFAQRIGGGDAVRGRGGGDDRQGASRARHDRRPFSAKSSSQVRLYVRHVYWAAGTEARPTQIGGLCRDTGPPVQRQCAGRAAQKPSTSTMPRCVGT